MNRFLREAAARLGRSPSCVVRAPGRVNLIGEHTDYNDLPVLPMAIDRSISIAAAARDDRSVHLHNAGAFAARSYTLGEDIEPFAPGDWGNYSKAAAQGLARYRGSELRRGADLFVDGDIPAAAGLSSSAALVVANALALMAVNDIDIGRETLAGLLARAERYVGTLSGGMDQTVSLLAREGQGLRIDFVPLRCRTVPLPQGYSWLACNSLVRADKSSHARAAYNLRVIECRLACCVLEATLADRSPEASRKNGAAEQSSLSTPPSLGALIAAHPELGGGGLLGELSAVLPERRLSLAEIAAAASSSADRLRTRCGISAELGDGFAVLRRARHVLNEAARVDAAEEALRNGDLGRLAEAMNASHESCRDDYEISAPELEELVALARDAGAIAARLTGAGFGGCTINLLADEAVAGFLARVDERFYRSRLRDRASMESSRFRLRPSPGAEVVRLG